MRKPYEMINPVLKWMDFKLILIIVSGSFGKMRQGIAVPCSMPSTKSGLYWGYRARLASSLGAVFSDSPYEGGYDLTIGTSERGKNVDDFALPKFRFVILLQNFFLLSSRYALDFHVLFSMWKLLNLQNFCTYVFRFLHFTVCLNKLLINQ